MKSKFDFFEVAKVASDDPELAEVNGEKGIILGKVYGDDGVWLYSVHFEPPIDGWDLPEYVLIKTGEFVARADVYDDSHIVVSSKGEIIGGEIKDDPDEK